MLLSNKSTISIDMERDGNGIGELIPGLHLFETINFFSSLDCLQEHSVPSVEMLSNAQARKSMKAFFAIDFQ